MITKNRSQISIGKVKGICKQFINIKYRASAWTLLQLIIDVGNLEKG